MNDMVNIRTEMDTDAIERKFEMPECEFCATCGSCVYYEMYGFYGVEALVKTGLSERTDVRHTESRCHGIENTVIITAYAGPAVISEKRIFVSVHDAVFRFWSYFFLFTS